MGAASISDEIYARYIRVNNLDPNHLPFHYMRWQRGNSDTFFVAHNGPLILWDCTVYYAKVIEDGDPMMVEWPEGSPDTLKTVVPLDEVRRWQDCWMNVKVVQ